MALFQTVEAAPEPRVSAIGCLHHADMEALVHPVVDVRVFGWFVLLILLFWLSSQLHGAHDVALVLRF